MSRHHGERGGPADHGLAEPHRRDALEAMARFGTAAMLPGVLPGLAGCASIGAATVTTSSRADLIREENARSGTRDWLLRNPRLGDGAKYRSPAIEGYVSRTSVFAGQPLSFFVSTNPAASFVIDVYRLGFYAGAGARHVARLGPHRGRAQEDPAVGTGRVRECQWESCETLSIPAEWPSGVYLGKLSREGADPADSYVIFVVKDRRAVDHIVQVSDTTWQAYNRWPTQFSLYDDGVDDWYWGGGSRVSFDRPYGRYCQFGKPPLSQGSGEFLLWEFPLVHWIESQGLDVSYISNLDVHADAPGLSRARGLVSVGHDEYYSLPMFFGLKQAIADGLSVAFLSGNTCCGLVEVTASSDGRADRVLTRVDRYGPRDDRGDEIFVKMKTLPRSGPNESSLIGARSTGPIMGGAAWICRQPGHWLFEGTGMKDGDGIPGIVGWEFHGDPATDIAGLEIVAAGPTTGPAGPSAYTATVYPGPRGNIVFNAATCWWSDGLSEPPGYTRPSEYDARFGPDARVQRITANVLARMKRGA